MTKMYENLKRLTINGLTRYLQMSRTENAKNPQEQQREKAPEEQQADLDRIAIDSQEELARFRGVFPFDLFPDEIIINKTNITVIRHYFFFVSQKLICHFDDLVNSHVNVGPFFSSISIISKYFTDGQEDVKWLSRQDGEKVHAVLQGLLLSRKEGVDLKRLPKEEIIDKLIAIGKR